MARSKDTLTLKQQMFADAYIETGNASEAARRAGYSEKYAGSNSDKLIKLTKVQKYISERMELLQKSTIATQEEVLEYLTALARGELDEETLIGVGAGVQGKTRIKASIKDRTKAVELLGKFHGVFTDKLSIDGQIPVVIANADELTD